MIIGLYHVLLSFVFVIGYYHWLLSLVIACFVFYEYQQQRAYILIAVC